MKTGQDDALDARKTVKAVCPNCGKRYRLDDRYAGRDLKCRACGIAFPVPWSVETVTRPREKPPGLTARVLRRLKRIATGEGGKRAGRQKWLSERQRLAVRWGGSVLLLLSVAAGSYAFLSSDSAALMFGTANGSEVAVKRLVALEKELGVTLSGVRSAAGAEAAARRVREITEEQLGLWERLADWKQGDSLTSGDLNLLRTRYRDDYRKAADRVTAERVRVSKLEAGHKVLKGFSAHGADLAMARQRVLGGQSL